MKTNEELQKDVQNAIKWEPLLHAAEIGVTVKDGIVTLSGTVDGYYKKTQAEDAAKNVAGVKALVEKIEVRYSKDFNKSDNEIAAEVLKGINNIWSVPNNLIKVKVENGWITLEGELAWNYQREETKNAINYLTGVKGVTNNIKIKSEIHDSIEKKDVEKALARSWAFNSNDISVKVSGTNVTLTGIVSSIYQKEEAGRLAWKTPGIWSVENNLVVDYAYALME